MAAQVFVPAMKAYLLSAPATGPAGPASAMGSGASAVAAQALIAQQAPGHLNRSPILTALQHAQASQPSPMAPGQLIVKRAVGSSRSPLQPLGQAGVGGGSEGGGGGTGGSAYRTLSLDHGVALGSQGSSGLGSPVDLEEPPQLASPPHKRANSGAMGAPPPHPAHGRSYVPSRLGKSACQIGGLMVVNTSPRGMRALQPPQPDVDATPDQCSDLQQAPPPAAPGGGALSGAGSLLAAVNGHLAPALSRSLSRSPVPSSSPRGRKAGLPPPAPPPAQLSRAPGSGAHAGLATLLQALDTANEMMEDGGGSSGSGSGMLGRQEQAVMTD